MRKNVWKRCMAAILSAVVMFTSVDVSWAATNLSSGESVEITLGEVVADKYELEASEKAVLGNANVLGNDTITFTAPAADAALVTVDPETKVITAADYTDPQANVWKPVKATVHYEEAGEAKTEEIGMNENSCTFTYAGNTYSVTVTYEASVEIATDVQQRFLNTPYYLARGIEAPETILNDNKDYLDIIDEALPVLKSEIVDNRTMIEQLTGKTLSEETVEAIECLNEEFELYELARSYSDKSSKVGFYLSNGSSLKDVLMLEHDKIETIGNDTTLAEIASALKSAPGYEQNGTLLSAALGSFKSYAKATRKYTNDNYSSWNGLKEDLVSTSLTDEAAFEALVGAVADDIDYEIISGTQTATGDTTFVIASTEVECNVNRYNVTVNITANVMAGTPDSDEATVLNATETLKLNGGISADEVKTAIKAAVDEQVAAWNNGTVYNIGTEYYTYSESDLSIGTDGLNADCTVTVTYEPQTYSVKLSDGTVLKSDAPYGYVITLPKHTDETQGYEYVVDGETLYQGATYRVEKDTTLTRKTGAARVEKTINELVADSNGLTGTEANILKSTALQSNGSITAKLPTDEHISLSSDGKTLTVKPWTDDFDNTWNVREVAAVDSNDQTIGNTITSFDDNKATIAAEDYDKVTALYSLDANVSNALDILNIPYELSKEVQGQMAGMQAIVNKDGQLSQVTKSVVGAVIVFLDDYIANPNTSATDVEIANNLKTQFESMRNNAFSSTGYLKLREYAMEYKALADKVESGESATSAPLLYYYNNLSAISSEYEYLKGMLTAIVTDDNMRVLEAATGMTSELQMLSDAKNTLDTMGNVDYFLTPMNSMILDNSAKTALLEDLIALEVEKHTESKKVYWDVTLTATPAGKYTIKYFAQKLDNSGAVIGTSTTVTLTKPVEEAVDTSVIENGMATLRDEVLAGKSAYYTLAGKEYYTGSSAETGTKVDSIDGLKESVVAVYKYKPNEYYVYVEGAAEQVIYYGNTTISLPAPADTNEKYVYTIGTVEVTVTSTSEGTHTFTDSQLTDFFTLTADGTRKLEVTRTVINISQEKVDSIFGTGTESSSLNDAFYGKQMTEAVEGSKTPNLTSAVIPYEKDGKLEAAALRVNSGAAGSATDVASDIVNSVVESLMVMIEPLAMQYEYIGLGGEPLYENGVSLNAAITALLASEIGTESIMAMFNADGTIAENAKDALNGLAVASMTESSKYNIPNKEALGALVLETTLELGSSAADAESLKFVISYNDFSEDNAEKAARKDLYDTLATVNTYVNIKGDKDGNLNAIVKEPISTEAYEAYLLAMIVEGQTDFASIDEVALKDIVDWEYNRVVPVLQGEDVTVTTLQNTLDKLGVTKDIDDATLQKVLDIIKNDGAYVNANGEKVVNIDRDEEANANAARDEYYLSANANSSKDIASKLGISDTYVKLIKEEVIDIPVKVKVNGLADDYVALVINDPSALKGISGANKETLEIAVNALTLVTLDEVKVGDNVTTELEYAVANTNNAMVIMLKDVDKDLTFNGKAILDLNGHKVGNVNANGGTVVLVDSTYDSNNNETGTLSADVKDARLNDFYTVSVDANGKVTVSLDAGFLAEAAEIETPELKVLAVEIAFDIIMNNITSGEMSIKGANGTYDIYDIEFANIIDLLGCETTELVNDALDMVKYPELAKFVNEILDTLTDFDALKTAINENKAIGTYTAITKPLYVEVAVAEDDYLTLNLTTKGDSKETTVEIVVSEDEAGEKAALAALCENLAEIVTKCDLSVALTDINYTNGSIAAVGAEANADIEIDLTSNRDYAAVFAMVVANGLDSKDQTEKELKDELIKAINTYLEDGTQADLKKAVDKITTAQLIKAVKAANGKTFADVLSNLSIKADSTKADELEAIYHDLLSVVYRVATLVSNKLGIDGNDKKLAGIEDQDTYGVYGLAHKGTHKSVAVDAKLVLKLFVKDTTEPENPTTPSKPNKPSSGSDDNGEEYVGTYYPSSSSTASTSSTGTSTGDTNNAVLWISVMGIAVVAVVAVLAMKKRKAK